MSVFDAIKYGREVSIKRMLHEAIPGYRKPRDHKIVHASDLTREEEFCPRQFALYDLTGRVPRDEWINTSQQTTFDEGTMIQALLREHWLGRVAVGHWQCKWCNRVKEFSVRPKKCGGCGKQWFKYNEVNLYSDELGVWGGLDILLDVGEPKLRFVELKIMDKDFWKALKMPYAEHMWRTKLYLKVIATSKSKWADRINSEVAHVLYKARAYGTKDAEAKEWNEKDKFSPFKEFEVHREDDAVRIIGNKARTLKNFREQGECAMPAGVCSSGFDKRAKFCKVAPQCFSGRWPARGEWHE